MALTEKERAERNLNPHAEAVYAMHRWSDEYSWQNGGIMDFWEALGDGRKRLARDAVEWISSVERESK